MVDAGTAKACGGCCFVLFIVSAFLVGFSFDTLHPLQAGLRLSKTSNSIQPGTVYLAGRYHVSLGRHFIQYPTTYQNIEYSDDPDATQAALLVNSPRIRIECSFQYTLNISVLNQIYREYEQQYHVNYAKIGKDIIQSATDATRFTTEQFYRNRTLIQATILQQLQDGLLEEGAVVHDFQLREVELQQTTRERITRTIVTNEESQTEIYNGTIRLIRADTSLIQGAATKEIRALQAVRQREADLVTSAATADAVEVSLNAQADAFSGIVSNLSFTQPQLMSYIWLRNLADADASTTIAAGYTSATVSPTVP